MADLWTAAPFVSHDGPDDDGFRAEVKVKKGLGNVFDVTASGAGKAMKVTFDTGHPKYKSSGWVPKEDPVLKVVEEAQANGEPLLFRIETKRNKGVDRHLPIAEISAKDKASDNVSNALVAVKTEDAEEWTMSPMALTRFKDDPHSNNGTYSANDYSDEELGTNKASSGNSAPHKFNGVESAPFVTTNPDGAINPGSMAVAAPLNIRLFIKEYLHDQGIEVSLKEEMRATAGLLKICNSAQLKIYDGKLEKPDLSLGSHTRARQLAFESVKNIHPLTKEILTDPTNFKEWIKESTNTIVEMWKWSISEVEGLM